VSRKWAALLAIAALFVSAHVVARPPPAPRRPHAPALRPAPPLATLPSIGRVRIEAAKDRLLILEEVHLPRGDWQSGDLDLYVAFGAPGIPKAFDARILSLPAGESEANVDDAGEPVITERAPHRPLSAQVLVGRAQMAGAILHLKEAPLRSALAPSDTAVLRLRTLLDLPPEDSRVGREVVVRLGVPGAVPLTLGRIQIVSLEARAWITHAEAQLCGPEADTWPLALSIASPPPARADLETSIAPVERDPRGPISPRMALRHASDDLCIRFSTR
jgi:hypothetical protein